MYSEPWNKDDNKTSEKINKVIMMYTKENIEEWPHEGKTSQTKINPVKTEQDIKTAYYVLKCNMLNIKNLLRTANIMQERSYNDLITVTRIFIYFEYKYIFEDYYPDNIELSLLHNLLFNFYINDMYEGYIEDKNYLEDPYYLGDRNDLNTRWINFIISYIACYKQDCEDIFSTPFNKFIDIVRSNKKDLIKEFEENDSITPIIIKDYCLLGLLDFIKVNEAYYN